MVLGGGDGHGCSGKVQQSRQSHPQLSYAGGMNELWALGHDSEHYDQAVVNDEARRHGRKR